MYCEAYKKCQNFESRPLVSFLESEKETLSFSFRLLVVVARHLIAWSGKLSLSMRRMPHIFGMHIGEIPDEPICYALTMNYTHSHSTQLLTRVRLIVLESLLCWP